MYKYLYAYRPRNGQSEKERAKTKCFPKDVVHSKFLLIETFETKKINSQLRDLQCGTFIEVIFEDVYLEFE